MKIIILISMLLFNAFCMGQRNDSLLITLGTTTHGFVFAHGISWSESEKQDSIVEIIIEGDTMAAIRNLLMYCIQEKSEADYAGYVLGTLNLDNLSKLIKNEDFDFYLKQYRKEVEGNKVKRGIKPKKRKK